MSERIDLLYLGVRQGEDKPLVFLWYDLTGIVNDGSPLKDDPQKNQCYARKRGANIAFASPGQIYSFEKSESGVYSSTARYVGRWQCQDDVVKWTAESNAIERSIELAARAKKESKERLDWEVLEPFRRAYHGKLNYKEQQMLLCQVMQFITKYRSE